MLGQRRLRPRKALSKEQEFFRIVEGGSNHKEGRIVIYGCLAAMCATAITRFSGDAALILFVGLFAWAWREAVKIRSCRQRLNYFLFESPERLRWIQLLRQKRQVSGVSAGSETSEAEAKLKINFHGLA